MAAKNPHLEVFGGHNVALVVEAGGNEPPSDLELLVLLRAQPMKVFELRYRIGTAALPYLAVMSSLAG